MPNVSPKYLEKRDRCSLQKTMKKALKNKKLEPGNLIKSLYLNTYVHVADILEHNAHHSTKMVRAAQTAIKLGLAEGDAEALTTTLTVAELLDKLSISVNWDDIDLLYTIVRCLPEKASALAMTLLERYEVYLDVYEEALRLKDQLTEVAAATELTKELIPVEVTVAKELSEFTCKDCKELLAVLLCHAFRIPRKMISVTEARSGDSTTVVFVILKACVWNVIQYSVEGVSLWAYKELGVTKVRIPSLFEVNVSQLLTVHFKAALRSGLIGDVDFVGVTKVCSTVWDCDLMVLLFCIFVAQVVCTTVINIFVIILCSCDAGPFGVMVCV